MNPVFNPKVCLGGRIRNVRCFKAPQCFIFCASVAAIVREILSFTAHGSSYRTARAAYALATVLVWLVELKDLIEILLADMST